MPGRKTLTKDEQILAGGERAHIEDALPLFRQISGRMYHVGKYVDAIHMKSIHQVVGLSNFMAGIEIMHIGRECGFNSRVSRFINQASPLSH